MDSIVSDVEVLAEFLNEGSTHLNKIENALLSLEKSPHDIDLINEIFRAFHSIKGGAGFLGLKVIGDFSHDVENLLDEARNKNIKIITEVIDILFESIDLLKKLLCEVMISKGITPPKEFEVLKKKVTVSSFEISSLVNKIKQIMELKQDQSDKYENYEGEVIEKEGKVPKDLYKKLGDILVDQGKIKPFELRKALEVQKKYKKIGEILLDQGVVRPDEVEKALSIQKKFVVKKGYEDIRVDLEKVNNIVDIVGELVISHSFINQLMTSNGQSHRTNSQHKIEKELTNHGKLVKQIQSHVLSIRMIPIKPTYQKIARLVRDLSKKQGKEVEFNTSGENTEVDKTILEELNDPLVHIIRNAIDHGIESADERKNKGKTIKGTVSLSASHKGGNIVIKITDDGKGLSKDRILKKGLKKGILSSNRGLNEGDIFNLIFIPGFSTADKVTEVSGRGVGMDVVKRNIEKLRGKVEISSKEGTGSTFTIRLPLTMAIIDGMVVSVANDKFIIPIFSIIESIRPSAKDISKIKDNMELIDIRGDLLPLIRLHHLYNIKPKTVNPWEAMVIVVEEDNRRVCILVDELLGQQQVVIKRLDDVFGKIKSISGGAILGDGKVSLILDVEKLIKSTASNVLDN